ncbi:MAG: hypothetical protein JXC85_01220 [Candidatus Aenigmarchaeota archaeon]|nr:hypothetical protein [Candidatus Aenigmarchaeota archaeon]
MRKIGLLLAIVSFIALSANARAFNICDYNHLPSYPSANSSMLLIIPRLTVETTLSNLTHPMKVSYWVSDEFFNVIDEGSLLKFNDCWVCEFSGKVSNFYGNCGPTPFRNSGQYRMYYTAKDFYKEIEFNKTVLVHSLGMASGVSVDANGNVKITVDAPTNSNEVWMTLFDAETGDIIQDFNRTNLEKTEYPGRYLMDINSLGTGTYYAAFGFRTDTMQAGGSVSKFEIKTKETELSVETDSDSYWLGEEVIISGQTKYDQVSAGVLLPSGRTESLGTKSVSNQQYSITFKLLNTYEEGNYVVTVNAGGASAQRSFSVDRVLQVSPAALTFLITNKTGILQKTVTVQNMGNTSVSLSASTEDITSYTTLTFDRTSISPGSSATLTVKVNPATLGSSKSGRVIVTGNSIVSVPVDVSLNLAAGDGEGAKIEINPGFWETDDCMVGVPLSPSFTVQNTGTGNLGGFGHSLSSDLDDITEVTLPSSSLSSGSFGSIELEVTPNKETISGWVKITSTGGQDTIYISLDCARDLTMDLNTMQSDVEYLKSEFLDAGFSEDSISSIFYTLDAEISDAMSDMNSGEYATGKASYQSAQTRYNTLGALISEIGSAPIQQADTSWVTWVVVIVVLVLLAFVGFILYKKFGSKLFGAKGGEEEAYEEELY